MEVFNEGDTPVNMEDLFLTDDPLDLQKFPLLSGEEDEVTALPPGALTVAWFYGGDEQKVLSPAGGTLFLVEGRKILSAVTYEAAVAARSYGYLPHGEAGWRLLSFPSPGAFNEQPFFLRADVNADLRVDVADPILALEAIFSFREIACADASRRE